MAISKAEVERRLKRFADTCRRSGLKITHQRTEVFRELAARDDHPGAEAVYQAVRGRVPAISRDTVYRALALLEAQGLIRKAEILFNQGRYDANTERHHHFVCTACGRVQDFQSEVLDDLPLPRSAKSLGRVQSASVQVRGVCSVCAERKGKRKRAK